MDSSCCASCCPSPPHHRLRTRPRPASAGRSGIGRGRLRQAPAGHRQRCRAGFPGHQGHRLRRPSGGRAADRDQPAHRADRSRPPAPEPMMPGGSHSAGSSALRRVRRPCRSASGILPDLPSSSLHRDGPSCRRQGRCSESREIRQVGRSRAGPACDAGGKGHGQVRQSRCPGSKSIWNPGQGGVNPTSSVSNSTGRAETAWTLGGGAGQQSLVAKLDPAPSVTVGFTAHGHSGCASDPRGQRLNRPTPPITTCPSLASRSFS